MESQPQNPKFRINPENFHTWIIHLLWFSLKNEKSLQLFHLENRLDNLFHKTDLKMA